MPPSATATPPARCDTSRRSRRASAAGPRSSASCCRCSSAGSPTAPDPDAGLLAFRRLSEDLGTTHWYLKMLRDAGAAAERMAHVLSSSRYVAELLERGPEAVALLGDDDGLAPRPLEATLATVRSAAERHRDDPAAAALAALAARRRELVRTAIGDVAGVLPHDAVGAALTDAAIAALDGGLRAARRAVELRLGAPLPTRMLLVAMGRFGGRELGYGSDADVLFVHDPVPGADEHAAQEARDGGRRGAAPAAVVARPGADARGGRRPAPRGPQGPAGAVPGRVRGVLRPVGAALGGAGAAPGRARGGGPGARRAVHRARRPAALARRRVAGRRRPRDPPDQGPGRGGTAAARGRPAPPPQARPRRAVRRRVDGAAAAAAARGPAAGAAHAEHPAGAARRRRRRPRRPRRRRASWPPRGRSPPGCATPSCSPGDARRTRCPPRCASSTGSRASSAIRRAMQRSSTRTISG